MKNLKLNSLFICFLILTCISCRKDFFIEPSIAPTEFSAEFPFEFVDGLIVLKVEIRGQLYDFVLESGALTLVSKEVAQELGLKAEFSRRFDGSQKGKTKIDFLTLDKLNIAGVDFQETNIGIMDFSPINETSCFNFDGFIGPSLMQNAVWEIDYQNQVIKMTRNADAMDIPSNAEKIAFEVNNLMQPRTTVNINGQPETVKIDLGSSGGINIKVTQNTYDQLKDSSDKTVIEGFGRYSRAISGYGDPLSTKFARSNQVSIGNLINNDEIVLFKTNGSSTIGNQFFKNYRVILNWFEKEMILIPNLDPPTNDLQNFGFRPIFKDNKPAIGFIYTNSSAAKVGLDINDEIIAINGIAIQNRSKSDWCAVKNELDNTLQNSLSITIRRNGKNMEFTLEKMDLI